MNSSGFLSWVVRACMVVILISLPALSPDGSLWILAVICAAVVYEGFRALAVYVGGALIVIVEAVYGLDVGVLSISFALSVAVLLTIRRVISMTPWSQQDGWSLSDGFKSVVLGWLVFVVALTFSAFVGDVLFGYGAVFRRVEVLWMPSGLVVSLVLGVLTQVALRRMAIPFRRAILFGS